MDRKSGEPWRQFPEDQSVKSARRPAMSFIPVAQQKWKKKKQIGHATPTGATPARRSAEASCSVPGGIDQSVFRATRVRENSSKNQSRVRLGVIGQACGPSRTNCPRPFEDIFEALADTKKRRRRVVLFQQI